MIYRVVIIDNGGNEITLTKKDGKSSVKRVGDMPVDVNFMVDAVEVLLKAYKGAK